MLASSSPRNSWRYLEIAASRQHVGSSAQQFTDPPRACHGVKGGQPIDEVVEKTNRSGIKVVLWRAKLSAPYRSIFPEPGQRIGYLHPIG